MYCTEQYATDDKKREMPPLKGDSTAAGGVGVWGDCQDGRGVVGVSGENGAGVWGHTKKGRGVVGVDDQDGVGVWGESQSGEGVHAETKSTTMAAVAAFNRAPGTGARAIWAQSENSEGVHAETSSPNMAALAAINLAPTGTGAAIYAKKEGSIGHAEFFDGDVHVTRSVTVEGDVMLHNADCAEDFTIGANLSVEPGTVMVLGDEGVLYPSRKAHDKRVAGVVSGAGGYRPGIILDRQEGEGNRQPIALLGKVYCKVDARYGAIKVGDLLTTSDTPGHAMRVIDPIKAFGAVIGKALRPLREGRGLIPILIALQ